jgi:3'(2'), 5'-bisphosphate nucleotidase|tara:strand:+ start:86 stop:877 length:792 start_codon:yes stop_codon:yes gene_type:complete
MNRGKLLYTAINSALEGGKEILSIYDSDFEVKFKDNSSPLTEADKNSHYKITEILDNTSLPILSEEGRNIPFEERKNWSQFWMVDPLDGTKEFVNRNGEFTVNIALIENQKPTLGVIYVPVTQELYFADEKAFKTTQLDDSKSLDSVISNSQLLPLSQSRKNHVIVGSRAHMSEETEAFISGKRRQYGDLEFLSKGSSLKLCMIAEGIVDQYPRFAPTSEWDTAAGQAIVVASGGEVINWDTKEPLKYNKEDLTNAWFLAKRD